MDLQVSVTAINNAFLRLESFMNGTISDYQYFGFNEAFSKLFTEAQTPENFTYSNCKLIGQYWKLTERIRVDYDKSNFENYKAYENKSFCDDCEEIMYLNWDRIEDFMKFSTPDETAESEFKFSITSILNNPALIPEQSTKQETPKPELSLKQVALLYIYNGDHITTGNCNSIAEKYKHKSGHKLIQHYNKYVLSVDRNSSESKRKDNDLLRDIKKVIPYLSKGKQDKPKEEAEQLANRVQNNNYPNL